MVLTALSNAPGAASVTILNGATDTGYVLMSEAEWGDAVWDIAYSGPRGTQGRRPAQATPEDRPLILPVKVYGTSKDNLASQMQALYVLMDQMRRFGGTFTWQSNDQTEQQHFDVMAGMAGCRQWGNPAENKQRAVMVLEASCAPYLKGDVADAIAHTSVVTPAAFQLSDAIGGDAPALADIKVACSGGSAAPIWALIAWTRAPTTPLASSVAPWGVIEAETGASLSTWAATGDNDYLGNSGLQATAAGAGTASALFAIDPSTMEPDDYTQKEIDIEVWARVELASTLVSPKLILSAEPTAGANFGQVRYSNEWGSVGKQLVLPSSGTRFRFVRLGVVTLGCDLANAIKWNLKIAASWAAGSTGTFGLDYLVCVPARARCLSPSSKPNDTAYPKFIASTSDTRKTIRSDLSALTASGAAAGHPDHGLGGSLIELPPGDVELLVKLSSLVPDDPTSDATTEQESHTADITVIPTPRWHRLATA